MEIPTIESDYPVQPEPPKKRGWPKGKPRGPRKAAVPEPPKPPEAPIEPEPEVQAAAKPVARKRRRRAPRTGVTVGKKFYPCVNARMSDGWLRLYGPVGSADEMLIRLDGVTVIATKGVMIGEEARPQPQPTGYPWYPLTSGTTTTQPAQMTWAVSAESNPRQAELRDFNQSRNREMESLMGPAGSVGG